MISACQVGVHMMMASSCWICKEFRQTLLTSYKGLLDASVKQKETKDLKKNLLKISTGGGKHEEKPFDVVNSKFMQYQYPDAKSNTYCWPSVFEFEHPGESSDVISSMVSPLTNNKEESAHYKSMHRKRVGEDTEEQVFTIMWSLLQARQILSFLIHGYKWNKNGYPPKLNKVLKVDGELDLLISLPEKCLLSIEVKAAYIREDEKGVKDVKAVKDVMTKAFRQCEKTLTYISKVSYNLFHDKNIPFIKVAALPNCTRDDLGQMNICEKCAMHVITRDELGSIEEFYRWFDALITVLQSHQMSTDFDGDLHEKVIGRLLGPKCLMEEKKVSASQLKTFKPVGEKYGKKYGIVEKEQALVTFKQIEEKYGTLANIHQRWYQFNQEQQKVIIDEEKLLWLTGEPGSGKTLLFWNKIEGLLQGYDKDHNAGEKSTVIVIPGNGNDLLYKKYQYQFSNCSHPDNCDLCIENFCDDYPFRPKAKSPTCNILPKVIKMYQDKRREGVLHIFIDESNWLLKGTDEVEFKTDWKELDLERLGFVWVIQNPLSTNDDDQEAPLPGFKKVHLKHVMRMTKEAVKFVGCMLDRTLISGHGVAGDLPVLYRMACVCNHSMEAAGPVQCETCIHKRQVLLILKIFKDFKVSWKDVKQDGVSINDFAILMTETHKKYVGEIMEKYTFKFHRVRKIKEVLISYSSYFRGCEEKMVIIDLSDPAIKIENLMECLTRCLSQLVLIDTGIDHPDNKKDYDSLKKKISAATSKGLVIIKDVAREEIDREEMEFILKLK